MFIKQCLTACGRMHGAMLGAAALPAEHDVAVLRLLPSAGGRSEGDRKLNGSGRWSVG